MDPLTMAAIMAAVGAAKGEFIDKPREQKQRNVAATTQQWSPWTGMQAGPIKEHDTLGSAMQGAVTGYSLGQNMGAAKGAAPAAANAAGGGSAYNLGVQMPPGYTNTMNPQLGAANPYMGLWQQMGSH